MRFSKINLSIVCTVTKPKAWQNHLLQCTIIYTHRHTQTIIYTHRHTKIQHKQTHIIALLNNKATKIKQHL